MGWALLSVATQDVIQLQQLPLSVSQFDDTGRIGNDDECFLRSFLKLWGFFSQFTPNHHWVSALELFRYSAEEEAIYKRAPCVCSLWSAVCVNTEASAHTGVWTVREVDFFFFLIDLVWVLASYRPEQTQSACKERMAAPTKFSFSVRSILDLPEQDADAAKRSSPIYSSCSSSSPYSSWIDCERSLCMCKWAFKAMRDGW